ncbi:hypothetical protein GON26_17020 [Flavobacterium sp. GA093]|uniref:Uncharacterized protein n=1 Tax=Flavobacterium hydrocarbonoxydans TaxID=2683249 RepID=A0A6I4NPA5_9FLAO|nr:hypothetical protein [Flavobacterium hydrocarbonoxydans]MWB96070.1 hypothetical protein [Flavobacterium hydrocarbonoxydans]
MKQLLSFIILIISTISFGQTAIVNFQKVFPNVEETENYIKFEINGQNFGEKDSIISIRINKSGFDNCKAIINNDTLNFVAKFRENETYEIRQGCCCAAFTLTAQNNPNRGTVKFKNRTKRDLGLIVAEANIEKIGIGKTQNIYASESAMCLFKPCSILLTETEYLSEKYDYKSDERDYDTLWKEQRKYEIASIWFHFLHGEKIELFYNEKTKKIELNLIGYLTEKEFKKTIEEFNKNVQE